LNSFGVRKNLNKNITKTIVSTNKIPPNIHLTAVVIKLLISLTFIQIERKNLTSSIVFALNTVNHKKLHNKINATNAVAIKNEII
jgi:hypothetical protein